MSKTPFTGGTISKIAQVGDIATFIHVFTNTSETTQFVNASDRPVAVRLLAVGGGGKAGNGHTSTGNGGGGGAGTAGVNFSNGATGGEGLESDITGESLVYGSGGGGGGNINDVGEFNNGGAGGTRAGNSAYVNVIAGDESATTNIVRATAPVANSGAGGGGGIGGKGTTSDAMRAGTAGAAGIVVIRYDWNVAPEKKGFVLLFR